MIWTWPKWIGPIQNDWYSTKMIWTLQNNFGPIEEGQGISKFFLGLTPLFGDRRGFKPAQLKSKFFVIIF